MHIFTSRYASSRFVSFFIFICAITIAPTHTFAHRSPDTCSGSGLGISIFVDNPDVHVGDAVIYSIDIFNGAGGPVSCDATSIVASVVTPDGVSHPITLSRTAMSNGQVDSYNNVLTYIARLQDVKTDGTLTATANVIGTIHQNDTDSQGGGNQGLNVTITTSGTLHVVKVVVNDNGGVAVASAFSMHVKAADLDVSGSPAGGVASPGTSYTLTAETYTVSEDANASYTASFSGDCDASGIVILASGENKTCVVTNDDIAIVPPSIPPSPPPPSGGGGGGGWTPPPVATTTATTTISVIVPPPVFVPPAVLVPPPVMYFPNAGLSPENEKKEIGVWGRFVARFFHRPSSFVVSTSTIDVVLPKSPVGIPIRLKIPSLNVNTSIEATGLTLAGAMGSTKGPDNVAWFSPGTRPGMEGSAVIAGHYGWKDGIAAVFDRLRDLKKGDKIYIEDANGSTTVFIVREQKKYDQDADASPIFYSHDGKAHLNLITCEGTWDKYKKSYSDRLVVFTEME